MERLQKHLAHCGVASRRKAEELILEGRVKVNGETVTELGVKVDPARDRILVDDKPVNAERPVYYLVNKPRGYVTTASDEYGRRTVLDLLEDKQARVYPVGRLDKDSEGLLVLTNDGALAYYLTHPACGVKKTYHVNVEGEVTQEELDRIVRDGIRLGPVLIQPAECRVLRGHSGTTAVEIVVGEGINREIRRLFAALGHEVRRLVRVRIGPLQIKGLGSGKYRHLRRDELATLHAAMDKVNLPATEATFPPGSAETRKPAGKRGRRVFVPRGTRLGKPDPALHGQESGPRIHAGFKDKRRGAAPEKQARDGGKRAQDKSKTAYAPRHKPGDFAGKGGKAKPAGKSKRGQTPQQRTAHPLD